jgi:hypothetical protein
MTITLTAGTPSTEVCLLLFMENRSDGVRVAGLLTLGGRRVYARRAVSICTAGAVYRILMVGGNGKAKTGGDSLANMYSSTGVARRCTLSLLWMMMT